MTLGVVFSPSVCCRAVHDRVFDRSWKKLADQNRRWVLSGFLREALGQRGQSAFGQIEFQTLDAMHGKEYHARGKRLAIANLRREIVERRKIDAPHAEPDRRKMQDRAPEFFARVGKRRDHKSAGAERGGRLGSLIKANAGHDAIVVCARIDCNWKTGGRDVRALSMFAFIPHRLQIDSHLLGLLIKM